MQDNEFVIYTAMYGHYQSLPKAYEGVKCICFTDDKNLTSNDWEIRYVSSGLLDSARESRRVKLMPHKFLQDYEWSLYIDATVTLNKSPQEILDYAKSHNDIFYCFHNHTSSILNEVEELIEWEIEDEKKLREQIDFYQNNNLLVSGSPIFGCFLLRKHNEKIIKEVGERWFEQLLRFSKRDQVSFLVAAKSLNFTPLFIDKKKQDEFFTRKEHDVQDSLPRGFSPTLYLELNPDIAISRMDPCEHWRKYGVKEQRHFKRRISLLNCYANKYKVNKGDMFFEAHDYAKIYELMLRDKKDSENFSLLEINYYNEPPLNTIYQPKNSLLMWKEYFKRGKIYGLDLSRIMAGHVADDIEIYKDKKQLEQYDVIVDSSYNATVFDSTFSYLKSGGLYFIENAEFKRENIKKIIAKKTMEDTEINNIDFFDSQSSVCDLVTLRSLCVIRKK